MLFALCVRTHSCLRLASPQAGVEPSAGPSLQPLGARQPVPAGDSGAVFVLAAALPRAAKRRLLCRRARIIASPAKRGEEPSGQGPDGPASDDQSTRGALSVCVCVCVWFATRGDELIGTSPTLAEFGPGARHAKTLLAT